MLTKSQSNIQTKTHHPQFVYFKKLAMGTIPEESPFDEPIVLTLSGN
jgi:hypothetical protein